MERGDPAAGYRPVALGEPLGPLFATYWLRVTGVAPPDAALALDFGGEATIWHDGAPIEALSSGAATGAAVGAGAGAARSCSSSSWPATTRSATASPAKGWRSSSRCAAASSRAFDADAWALRHDLEFLLALEAVAEPEWAGELLSELHAFTIDRDRERLQRLLARSSGSLHEVSAVGHAHLDTAWLWPLEETYRKLVRTTTAQLRLLDDYPEHVFAHSQAQHYAWLRERAPELYARVRAAVRAGRWIPVGGSWIEPDCNLPSGESLARQFLYGQRFFESELGRRCTEFWQPDVFGYTAQLPQLMRQAGMTRFLTQKLSWNRFTQPEHHTFTWQGLDGTEVLTHFPPADTYNAEAHRRRAAPRVRGLQGPRPLAPLAARVRVRRRRRRADGRDARAAAARARRRRAAAHDGPLAGRVLRRARARRARPAHGRRRAVLRVAPRHVHVAGGDQARQPPLRGRAARRRAAGCAGGRRVSARAADDAVADAAAQPVPRHPARDLDHRSQRALAGRPRAGRGRRRGDLRRGAGRGRRAVQPARVRAPRGRRARRVAGDGRPAAVRGRLDRPRRRGARRARRRRRGAGQRAPAGDDRARRHGHEPRVRRPRGAVRARQPARALRGPAGRLGRVGRRPGAPRDARGRRPRERLLGHRAPAAGRGARRPRLDPADVPARRRGAPVGGPLRGRLAVRPPLPEGRVPARGARHRGDLRGRVRRRPAADALLDPRRPGALRGPGPPLGGPVRARLRRRRADRLEVRLLGVRRHAARVAAARAAAPGPRGRPRPPHVRLRPPPPPRQLAGRGRGGRGGGVQRARALGSAWRRAAWRARAAWCSTASSAPRTRTR